MILVCRFAAAVLLVLNFAWTSCLYAGYNFPKPTGQYAVGTVRYHMIDRNRLDPYDKSLFRELMVQVWYPASKSVLHSHPAHADYIPDLMPHMKRMATEAFYVPQKLLDYLLVDLKCFAYEDAPILEYKQKFPIVVLCHGLGSLAALHTTHAENLASHGFVVFGINHTFTCSLSLFPDGRVYPFKFDWKSPDKVIEFNKIVQLWQDDVAFVLSQIEDIAESKKIGDHDNKFFHKIDVNKIGMMGHSMGGATTTQILRRDKRVKAGVNMDGPLFGRDYDDGFKKPFMTFVAESSIKRTNTPLSEKELLDRKMTREEELYLAEIFKYGLINLCGNIRNMGSDAYYVYFLGAGHNTFTDVPLVKDASFILNFLEYFGLNTGTISPTKAVDISNCLLVDFFNKYLLQKPAIVLENVQARQFEEVIISR